MFEQHIEDKKKRHREYMRNRYWSSAEEREKVKRRSKEYSSRPEVRARMEQRRQMKIAMRPIVRHQIIGVEKVAYAAGIIDGEGSIQIRKVAGHNGEIGCRYELTVQVTNTYPQMIQFFLDHFGGYGFREPQRKKPGKWRSVYRWHVTGPRAVWVLRCVKPYLVCKTDQADLALSFRKSFGSHRYCRGGTPDSIRQFRHECYLAMKAMHSDSRPDCELRKKVEEIG